VFWSSVGRRGNYGVDAPAVPVTQATLGVVLLELGTRKINNQHDSGGWWLVGAGVILLAIATVYVHTARRGRFLVWSEVLGGLNLVGDERVLDLGCGRGAVTTLAAARVPRGSVLGVDSFRARSRLTSSRGGTEDAIARRNASLEGVADRVAFVQADLTRLNLDGNSFDLVVSGLGLSTVPDAEGRRAALEEAVRVTRPDGRLVLADVRHTDEYVEQLTELGCVQVEQQPLGWRVWYGGPWASTTLVTARKPVA
jgi:SAM-dependent methyltransferase